jgi:hypothetical protein
MPDLNPPAEEDALTAPMKEFPFKKSSSFAANARWSFLRTAVRSRAAG